MSQAHRRSRGLDPIGKAARVFGMSGSTLIRLDPARLGCTAIPAGGRVGARFRLGRWNGGLY